ncbi:MAG: thioredoxin family protein [Candidatus Omnitrophota bacterium]
MLKNIAIIILSVLAVCVPAAGADAISWQSDLDSALDRADSSGDPIMADFYTTWCHWCKKMDSDTYSDMTVNSLAKDFICVQIDADRNRETARKYSVSGYPTVIFLNSSGDVIQTVTGYRSPDAFASIMEGVLKMVEPRNPEPKKKPAGAPAAMKAKEPDNRINVKDAIDDLQKKMKKMRNHNMELEGILYNKERMRAIINNTIVKVGDKIEGATVVKIGSKNVVLSLGNETVNLKLD